MQRVRESEQLVAILQPVERFLSVPLVGEECLPPSRRAPQGPGGGGALIAFRPALKADRAAGGWFRA